MPRSAGDLGCLSAEIVRGFIKDRRVSSFECHSHLGGFAGNPAPEAYREFSERFREGDNLANHSDGFRCPTHAIACSRAERRLVAAATAALALLTSVGGGASNACGAAATD